VPEHILDVAVEGVHRRQPDGHRQGEDELHGSDDR
jgi:hypothetical protein